MKNINKKNIVLFLVLFMIAQLSNAQSQLWGLTNQGGLQFGTIFSLAPGATTLTNQFNLPGIAGQSSNLLNLIQGSDGGLYGMTPNGGIYGYGIIFRYDPGTDTYVEKASLNSSTGDLPNGSLIQASDNMFYGMTSSGGAYNGGVIFQYDPVSNVYTKMIDLEDATGSQPQGSMMQASNHKLYGMTKLGGAYSAGVLFEYDIANNVYTDLFDFGDTAGIVPNEIFPNGTFPVGNLIQASDNMLYGMTNGGGANTDGYLNDEQGFGVLFQYDISTSTFTKRIDLADATGKWPTGSLFQASDGILYGMTNYGGSVAGGYINGGHGYGVIFKYDISDSSYTDIVNLTSVNGSNPYGAFIQGTDGNLYSMTSSGGVNNQGTIFEFDIANYNYTYTKKFDLTASTGNLPTGSLMQASNGKFYGLANHSDNVFSAVLFQFDAVTDSFVNKKLITFSSGSLPLSSLIRANDGKLYGLTSSGGAYGNGVLFQYNPADSIYIDKVDLDSANGDNPNGSLVQVNDMLYGMTFIGGANNAGVIFRYDPVNNVYTDIFDLSDATGDYPTGNLILGTDGMLYGMTVGGGANGLGAIFKFDPAVGSNHYTDLYDFDDATGGVPYGSLILATDGKMYGMTSSGGTNYAGVLFLFNPADNSYNPLVNLSDENGDIPTGTLIQGNDGNLYGLTSHGGFYGGGVLFQFNPASGIYAVKIDLSHATGDFPIYTNNTLMQALNGKIYGTTTYGGTNDAGVVFEYTLGTTNTDQGTYIDKYDFNFSDGLFPVGNLLEICTPPDAPALSASPNSVCPGGSTTLSIAGNLNSATSWQWYTGSCGGTSVGSGASITINPASTTTYYARAEGACVSTTTCASITITVNANPTPTITGGSSFCSGSSEDLNTTGTSFVWGDNSTGSSLNITSGGTYSVTVTDNNGCTGTASKVVTTNALPAALISGTTTACTSVSLTASGGTSYAWDGGNNSTNATNTFTSTGTYSVTVTDANGCTGAASQSVTVNPLPTATITGNSSSCTTVTLTASGGTTYAWSGGNNTSSSSNTFASTGTYTVSVTDANGCVGTTNHAVTIYSSPSVSISSIGSSCSNAASISLSGTPSGGTFSGNGVSGTSFSPASAGAGTSTIHYSYTDSHGCSASASTSATVNANPTPQITSGVSSICSGSNAVLQVNGSYTSFSWNDGTHGNSITVNDSGNFVVTVTDAAGCTGIAGQHIAVIPSPTAFISTSNGTTICSGTTDVLDAGHFDSYVWSNGSVNEFVNVTTSGTWSVTITDVDGCTGVASKTITVNPNPIPTITAGSSTTFCAGGSVSLCSGQTYTTYNWGANGAGSCITVSAAGTYSLTVTNSNGCIGSASQSITINPKPSVTISSFANVSCTGLTNGSATATASGATSPYTYSWNTSPVKTTAAISSLAAGTYTLTVTSANGCTATASKVISTTADITPPVIATNASVPANTDVNSSLATVNLTAPTTTDNCSVATVTKNHASALYPVGTTTVIWTVTDAAGNTATSSQTVTVTDVQKPTIATPSAISANTAAGLSYATITLTAPTASDNTAIASVTSNHPSTQFPAGITTVIWTATDIYGNTTTTSQTVTVTDNQAPVAIARSISVTLVNGSATITASMVNNGSHDNVGIIVMSVTPSTFNCTDIGANTVTLTVTDAHGNNGTAHCTVTVIGANPSRTITITPSNNTYTGGDLNKIYLGYGPQSVTLNGTESSGSGGCGGGGCGSGSSLSHSWAGSGLSCNNCVFPMFTPNAEGSYTFVTTVTNSYGCTATASVSFCVFDVHGSCNGNNKVNVCHLPPGNPANYQEICISINAVPAHISNHPGDHLGTISQVTCGNARVGIPQEHVVAMAAHSDENQALEIFPNPTNNTSTVYFNAKQSGTYSLRLTDYTGRIVNVITGNSQEGENTVNLDISTLAQGIYLVSLQNNEGIYKTKLMKE